MRTSSYIITSSRARIKTVLLVELDDVNDNINEHRGYEHIFARPSAYPAIKCIEKAIKIVCCSASSAYKVITTSKR